MEVDLSKSQYYKVLQSLLIALTIGLSTTIYSAQLVAVSDGVNELLVTPNYIDHHPEGLPEWLINKIVAQNPEFSDTIEVGSKWLQVTVTSLNPLNTSDTWLIEFQHPLSAQVNLIVTSNNEFLSTKIIKPLNLSLPNPQQNRLFVESLSITPNQTYKLWIQTSQPNHLDKLSFKIIQPTQLFFNELSGNHIFGIFFGVFIAMMIYNLFMLVSTGNLAYLFYTIFIGCSYLSAQAISGYGVLFVLGSSTLFNGLVFQIAATLTVVSGLLFARYFILPKHYSRYFAVYINAMTLLGIMIAAIALIKPELSTYPQLAFIAVASLASPIFVYRCWKNGSIPAGTLLLAWCMVWLGGVLYLMQTYQLLPTTMITGNAVLIGSAAEMLLLSFGLADRINREKKEKYAALRQQHDVILRLKEAEDRLMHRALHSRTTGLPNRTYLRNVLDDLIAQKIIPEFSLILVSLNNFHEFNKTLGHSNGDAILYLITERLIKLSENVPEIVPIENTDQWTCSVSAVEGVNFALIVKGNSEETLSQLIQDLLDDIEKPFEYDHLTLDVDATAGIAMYPIHSNNSEQLMRNAHVALEVADSSNKKYALYSQEIDPYNSRRISLLGELRNAIESETLQLYFQPQVSLSTLKIKSAEVLVRWDHPEYGFVPPDEFIPLAEKTGVIQPLTYLICKMAFEHKRRLDSLGMRINFSINISARNLLDPKFKDKVCQLAAEYNIDLKEINMELTETAVMSDPDSAMKMMEDLSKEGIQLSIDDFGTGYSCLSYLKKLPVDEIKIDRSFVMDMVNNKDDKMIVLTTLIMGHNLSLAVVAEGIEDEPTLAILKEMGCDTAQGYHIARPMPVEAFIHWLSSYQHAQEELSLNKGLQLHSP